MGVDLAILGLFGVVIGSDTMDNTGHLNVRFDSHLKLHPFGKREEFGLYFSGSNNILGIPITTLIEECNANITKDNRSFKQPSEAGLYLLNYYESSIDYFQIKNELIAELFENYLDNVVRFEVDFEEESESEIIETLSKLNLHEVKADSNPYAIRLDLYFNKTEISKLRTKYRKYILETLNLQLSTSIYNLIFDAMARSDVFNGRVTINIAGFNESSPYPELFTLRVFGWVDGRILYNHETTSTSRETPVQVVVDGERGYIERFIGGADFQILTDYSNFYLNSLIKYLKTSDRDFSDQIDYLEELKPVLEEEFQLVDTIPLMENELAFYEFLTELPHQEIINVVYELVRMTILLSQYNFSGIQRAGNTGGKIIIGTIKKHQSFKYVKRGDI